MTKAGPRVPRRAAWDTAEKKETWDMLVNATESIMPAPMHVMSITDRRTADLVYFQDRWGKTAPDFGRKDFGTTCYPINRSPYDVMRFYATQINKNPDDISIHGEKKYRVVSIGRGTDIQVSQRPEFHKKIDLLFLDYLDTNDPNVVYSVSTRLVAPVGVVSVVSQKQDHLAMLDGMFNKDGFETDVLKMYRKGTNGSCDMWIGIWKRRSIINTGV